MHVCDKVEEDTGRIKQQTDEDTGDRRERDDGRVGGGVEEEQNSKGEFNRNLRSVIIILINPTKSTANADEAD